MAQLPLRDLRPATPPLRNVSWQDGTVERSARWQRLNQHGATVWFTGLSGSGKSTVAAAVEEQLIAARRWAYRLDGDNLRHGVCSDLSFSRADRAENARRVAELALLFADAGAVALVCLVSPYAADRLHARELHHEARASTSSRCSSTRASTSVRGATSRASTRRPAAARWPTSPASALPTRCRAAPDVELTENLDVAAAAARVLRALPAVGG